MAAVIITEIFLLAAAPILTTQTTPSISSVSSIKRSVSAAKPCGSSTHSQGNTYDTVIATNTRRALLAATLHEALAAEPGQRASENAAQDLHNSLQ